MWLLLAVAKGTFENKLLTELAGNHCVDPSSQSMSDGKSLPDDASWLS